MERSMTVLIERLDIERPIEDVFAFVGDFANSEHWDPGVASARRLTDDPIQVGTRYELVVRFNGKEMPMTYEVTRWDPPNLVELEGRGARTTALDEIRFTATQSGGTRIDYRADIRLRGPLRILEPFMRKRFEQVGTDAMAGMRRTLGSGAAAAGSPQ